MRRLMIATGAATSIMLAVPGIALAATGGGARPQAHPVPRAAARPAAARPGTAGTGAAGTVIRIPLAAAERAAARRSRLSPRSSPVTSTFDFANSNIAHFSATLTFITAHEFKITNVKISDTLCDGRSALAIIVDQKTGYITGTSPNEYYWKDGNGCNTTANGASTTLTVNEVVDYIQIYLYAANSSGFSDPQYSLQHANPFA